ncbi:hypothetical protein FOA52_014702 [Chlamydomonas sp. UWO 241]|nr:hypothetical protein FOA52_014702 [Chlamydomonas sp. UWO 241]
MAHAAAPSPAQPARVGRELQRYADTDGARLVAGCIPARWRPGSRHSECIIEVLLVSSRGKDAAGRSKASDGKGLCFPKGGWELDETAEEAARRECVEEAGVRGTLMEPALGAFAFMSCKPSARASRTGGRTIAHMYLLAVDEQLDTWPEGGERTRLWVALEDAARHCRYEWMARALETLIATPGWKSWLSAAAPQSPHLQQPRGALLKSSDGAESPATTATVPRALLMAPDAPESPTTTSVLHSVGSELSCETFDCACAYARAAAGASPNAAASQISPALI